MFYDYTLKEYMEACFLIMDQEVPVERFRQRFSLNRYEYGISKQRLKEMEKFYDATFEFGERVITVTGGEGFQERKRGCWTFYNKHRGNFAQAEEFVRGLYIVKRLLLGQEYTNLEELTQEMGFSRSNMRGAMKVARTFLGSYGIKVENVPHHGVRPVGNELKICRSLVALYNFLEVNVIPETDVPEIARALSAPAYPQRRGLLQEVLERHGSTIAQARMRKLNFFVAIQQVRIRMGHRFEGFGEEVDEAVAAYVASDPRLEKISREILQSLEERLGYGPYTEWDRQALAFMLLETFEDEGGLRRLISEHYAAAYDDLRQELRQYLGEYGVYLQGTDQLLMENVLREVVASNFMGILEEKSGDMEGTSALITDYPLIRHIHIHVGELLKKQFGREPGSRHSAAVCELAGLFILNMEVSFPRLRIGVGVRKALYKPETICELMDKSLDKRYYQSVQVSPYWEILGDLEAAGRKYDVVICDQRLSKEKLFLSLKDFGYDFQALNRHLRMMRDLCGGTFRRGDIVRRDLDWKQEKDREACLDTVREYSCVGAEELERLMSLQGLHQGYLSVILPGRASERTLLQFGLLQTGERRGDFPYVVVAGKIDRSNVKLINVLLHELTHDLLFWDTMLQSPAPETINDQLNPLL